MGRDFKVTIKAGTERGELFERVFGSRTVCVRSPIPELANLPGRGRCWIYELDLTLIMEEQRARLIEYIARRFGIPVGEVDARLEEEGVPILAEDVVVSVANPQKWF